MIGAERLQLRGVALVLLSALCFGAISILVLLALGLGISLIELMQWRFVVATMILALVLRGRLRAPPRLSLPLFAVGAVGQAAVTFVSLSALQFIRPAAMSRVARCRCGGDRIRAVHAFASAGSRSRARGRDDNASTWVR